MCFYRKGDRYIDRKRKLFCWDLRNDMGIGERVGRCIVEIG